MSFSLIFILTVYFLFYHTLFYTHTTQLKKERQENTLNKTNFSTFSLFLRYLNTKNSLSNYNNVLFNIIYRLIDSNNIVLSKNLPQVLITNVLAKRLARRGPKVPIMMVRSRGSPSTICNRKKC